MRGWPRRSPKIFEVQVGDKIGWLTVTGPYFRKEDTNNDAWFPCCDCGTTVEIRFRNLLPRKSCGCRQREVASKTFTTHGKSRKGNRIYLLWKSMRGRCISPSSTAYKNYGARGITVDPRWDDFEAFEAWALANGYDGKLDLDRRDNDGPYSPENCRFVTRSENLKNRRPRKK